MPHSTRRRKTPAAQQKHAKYTETPLQDGWTLVTHSPLRMQAEGANETLGTEAGWAGKVGDGLQTWKAGDGMTVARMRAEFERVRGRWRGCRAERWVRRWVERWVGERVEGWHRGASDGEGSGSPKGRGRAVKNAVCLALGSLSAEGGDRMRRWWQFVVFMDVIGMLSSNGLSIKLYAQDPRFNSLDEEFLQSMGITVLLKPEATKHITQDTFLYVPFLQWDVLLPEVVRGKDPMLYIGNTVAAMPGLGYSSLNLKEEEEVADYEQIAKRFTDARQMVDFPNFELHQNALEGLKIYWRKEIEEG